MIKIINVTKNFRNTKALDNVSMNIEEGDIYGFIGENGAGKSTLIKIISNVILPSSGDVVYDFDNYIGAVQAIVEEPSLHMDLSALDNLKYQNDLFNLKLNEQELVKTLILVGLGDVVNSKKKAKRFSLGMKQRLSIAMSILPNPKVVLLDEPLNGLDPIGIKEIRELIINLNKEQGITFLISSHILSELDRMATKYGFISKGVLIKEISSKDLHESSKNYIKVTFDNDITEDDLKVLKKYEFKQESSNVVRVYGEAEKNELMRHLIKNDCLVNSVDVINKSIEEYYIEIIGGKTNA